MSEFDAVVYEDDPAELGFIERAEADVHKWGGVDELVDAVYRRLFVRNAAPLRPEGEAVHLPAQLLAAVEQFTTGSTRATAAHGVWWLMALASARWLSEQAPSRERLDEVVSRFRHAPHGAHGALLDRVAALVGRSDEQVQRGWADMLGAAPPIVRTEPDPNAAFVEYTPGPDTSITDAFQVWNERRLPVHLMLDRCALQLLHRLGLDTWLERVEAWHEPLLVAAELHARLLAPRWDRLRFCFSHAKPAFNGGGRWKKPMVGAVALAWLPVRYAEHATAQCTDSTPDLEAELRQTWDALLDRGDGKVIAGGLLVELAARTARPSADRRIGIVLARDSLAERMVAKKFSAARLAKDWATERSSRSRHTSNVRTTAAADVCSAVSILVKHDARVDLALVGQLVEMIASADRAWRSYHEAGRLEPALQEVVELMQPLGEPELASVINRVECRYAGLDAARLRERNFEDDAAFASFRLLWVLAALERACPSIDPEGARLSAWLNWAIRLLATSWDHHDSRSHAHVRLLGLLLVRAQSRSRDAFDRGLRYAMPDPTLLAVVAVLLVEELGRELAARELQRVGINLDEAVSRCAAWAAATGQVADLVAARQLAAELARESETR